MTLKNILSTIDSLVFKPYFIILLVVYLARNFLVDTPIESQYTRLYGYHDINKIEVKKILNNADALSKTFGLNKSDKKIEFYIIDNDFIYDFLATPFGWNTSAINFFKIVYSLNL